VSISSLILKQAIKIAKKELKKVLEWLAENKLINLDNTNLMVFTNKRRLDNVSITVRGHTINEITETSFLGVIIDNKPS